MRFSWWAAAPEGVSTKLPSGAMLTSAFLISGGSESSDHTASSAGSGREKDALDLLVEGVGMGRTKALEDELASDDAEGDCRPLFVSSASGVSGRASSASCGGEDIRTVVYTLTVV